MTPRRHRNRHSQRAARRELEVREHAANPTGGVDWPAVQPQLELCWRATRPHAESLDDDGHRCADALAVHRGEEAQPGALVRGRGDRQQHDEERRDTYEARRSSDVRLPTSGRMRAMSVPTAVRSLSLAVALVLGAACSDSGGTRATTSTPVQSGAPTGASVSPPRPMPSINVRTVRVEVKGGKRVGPLQRVRLRRGERIWVIVTSDVVDDVHAHVPGKNLRAKVGPSGEATLGFSVNVAGVFEVELEKRHLLLLELEVR